MRTVLTLAGLCGLLGILPATASAVTFGVRNVPASAIGATFDETRLLPGITDRGRGIALSSIDSAGASSRAGADFDLKTLPRLASVRVSDADYSPGSNTTVSPFDPTTAILSKLDTATKLKGIGSSDPIYAKRVVQRSFRYDGVKVDSDGGRLLIMAPQVPYYMGVTEPFVVNGPTVVPAPSALLLATLGSGLLALVRRRLP